VTTEAVLLLCLIAFLLFGAMFSDKGPVSVFKRSGPRLAARVEQNLATGYQFKKASDGAAIHWERPSNGAPDGKFGN
jgi:hypothetical protein